MQTWRSPTQNRRPFAGAPDACWTLERRPFMIATPGHKPTPRSPDGITVRQARAMPISGAAAKIWASIR
jgi:hypothetical protein